MQIARTPIVKPHRCNSNSNCIQNEIKPQKCICPDKLLLYTRTYNLGWNISLMMSFSENHQSTEGQ